jgi:hypothetical protein
MVNLKDGIQCIAKSRYHVMLVEDLG